MFHPLRIFLLALVLAALAVPAYARKQETITWGLPDEKEEAAKGQFSELEHRAQQGDPVAQYDLGNRYYGGEPELKIEQQLNKAAEWFRKSADGGNVEAQYRLGVMNSHGEGMVQDYTEAAKWFRKAANQGHVRAQYELASLLLRGLGVPEDYSEAYFWLLIAAKAKNPDAAAMLQQVAKSLPADEAQAMGQLANAWKPGDSK